MNGTSNTNDKGPVQVRLYLSTKWVGASEEEVVEVDRAEWDEMTPNQRSDYLDEMANDYMANTVEYGWLINDPEDDAATGTGAP